MSVEGKETKEGLAKYNGGDFRGAIDLFLASINKDKREKGKAQAHDFNYLACCLYALKDFKQALTFFDEAVKHKPDSISYRRNLGLLAYRTGDYKRACEHLDVCLKHNPKDFIVLDAYASFFHKTQGHDKSVEAGRKSLSIKNEEACNKKQLQAFKKQSWVLKKINVPEFKIDNPAVNIISYSLWGSSDVYVQGAIRNSQIVRAVFPSWTCRFYCEETVPHNALEELRKNDAQVIMMKKTDKAYYGLFWRFLVANDSKVERYLIRDADSLLTCQERLAVDEWIESKELFHLIRNYYTHTELILAGLWGGIRGALPNIQAGIDSFYKINQKERTIDQVFLRRCVWPLIKDNHLVHDDYYSFGKNVKSFSNLCLNHPAMHIGQNWRATLKLKDSDNSIA